MVPFSTSASLLNAIGINTHMNYAAYQNAEMVASSIKSLGIRNVRDGLHYWGNNDALNVLYESLVSLGTSFCYVVDPSENLGPLTQPMLDEYDWLSDRRIKYFEGPNEKDFSGDPNWVANTRAFQQSLAAACRPMAQGLSVSLIAPSLANTGNASLLGDMTALCDYGNLHAYPAGNPPETILPPLLKQVQAVSGNKPGIVTECGYPTTVVPEAAQNIYLPRLILSYWQAGASGIYLYELLDQEPITTVTDEQLHLGLIRSDGTEKPAFAAVRNLLGLLSGGSASSLHLINLSISNATVSGLLLQHTDSSWLLFLWQPVSVYNLQTKSDISNPPVAATVTLPKSMNVKIYEPCMQSDPVNALTGATSITLEVQDHPTVLKIG